MNQPFDKQANLNLPPPVPEAPLPAGTEQAELAPTDAQELAATQEKASSQPATALPIDFSLPMAPAQAQSTNDDVSTTTSAVAPVIADDNDLIEKEWVNKAKEIVAKTKEDPYRQSKELTTFKADYMKKRYNKEIKVSE